MAQSNTNTKKGVKYFYAEQYKWTAPILLYMYVSLYILLFIIFDDVLAQITRQN